MTGPVGGGVARAWMTEVSRSWGRVVFLGVLDLIAGILALAWPGITLLVLAFVLGFAVLLSAVGSLSVGIRSRNGWAVALGVIGLIAGIVMLLHPGTGIGVIALVATIYLFITGFADLSLAFTPGPGRVMWGVLGVISIAGGVALLANPWVAALTVAVVVGVTWMVRGVGEIATGFMLRRLRPAA